MAGQDSAARAVQATKAPAAAPPVGPPVLPFETIYHQYLDFVWAMTLRLGVSRAATEYVAPSSSLR